MSSDWPVCRISDVAEVVGGGTPSSKVEEYYGGDIPWITPKDLSSHREMYISAGGRNITGLGLSKSSAKMLPIDTVLLTSRAPIGYVAIAKTEVSTNQGFKSLILKEGNDPVFFYYLLKFNVPLFESRATGSTFKEISGQVLKDTELRIPDYETQKAIGEKLRSLDKKIELNSKINQTLEQMAQAIFKSWFVDFEPTKAKIAVLDAGGSEDDALLAAMQAIAGSTLFATDAADTDAPTQLARLQTEHPEQYATLRATAELFPSAMQESEMGEIPEGWKYLKISEVADIGIGKTPPRKESHWFSNDINDVKWVSIRDLGVSGAYVLSTSEYLTEEAVSKFNVRRIPHNTVLLSFKMTVGRVAITDGEMLSNEAIAHFKLANDCHLSSEYLYTYLKSFDYDSLGSTSSIVTAVNSKIIKEMPMLVPSDNVLSAFNKRVKPVFKKIKSTLLETDNLTEIRDTLLPKLLSGELSISAATDQITQAEEAIDV